ncbi:MAG: ABC transporter substrate-binding protein [Eubacteriales bacterium]
MRKRWIAGLLALGMMTGMLTGCGGDTAQQTTTQQSQQNRQQTDELVVAFIGEPAMGFDPTLGWGQYGVSVFQNALMTTDAQQNYIEDLAEKYEVSEDGLTWTFRLREGIVFSNGEPLDAQDVVFTYLTAKESQSEVDLTFLQDVTAVDEYTVQFTLKTPRSTFLHTATCVGIVPSDSYDPATYPENPIGTGAYKLVQWDKGQQCILERNDNYYGEKPYFRRITVLFMDEDQAILAAQSGQVDVAATAPQLASTVIPGMHVESYPTTGSLGMTLPYTSAGGTTFDGEPMGNDVTSDLAIRQAINVAVDREMLAQDALFGYGTPVQSETSGTPWENPDAYVKTGDPEAARTILEEAGWTDSNGDGTVDKNGVEAVFDLLYPAGDSKRQAVSMGVAQQLAEIGIGVNVQGKSWDDIDLVQHSTPVMYSCSGNTPQALYYNYYSEMAAVDYHNACCFADPTVDAHIEAALSASTNEEAMEEWKKVQWDGETGVGSKGQVARVWLVGTTQQYFVRDDLDVGEMKPQIGYHHDWPLLGNITQWKWKS